MRCLRPGYALALTLLITAPLLSPGYLLLRDAVSTPRSYLTDSALGLVSAPRATPQDFAIALASHLVDGGIVVKALLVAGLVAGGWGAGRLAALVLPESGVGGQLVAITLAIWNPYVGERLLQGHWSLLIGYGSLPWIAAAALKLRSAQMNCYSAIFALVFWIALAGVTPTGSIMAAIVGLTCIATPGVVPRRRCAAMISGISLASAAPWLTAALLGLPAGQMWAHTPGVAAFAARAEPGLGTLGSLAGLGGIWNGDAVPLSRTTYFGLVSTCVLVGMVAAGFVALRRSAVVRALAILALVSVALPAALATGPGLAALHAAVDALPALGVLRDGQKWVGLAMPGYSLAGAGAVSVLRRRLHPDAAAFVCCAALLLSLPDLAWGIGARMASVHYPDDWTAVAKTINRAPATVAVLPADTMRRFAWSGSAPVLDPLPRWLRAEVLTTGDLMISGTTVLGEGDHARAVQRQLLNGAVPEQLRAAGVGWLVVERGTPGEMGRATDTLGRLPIAFRGPDLVLYRVGGNTVGSPSGRRTTVLAAHMVWLALLLGGAVGSAIARRRRSPGLTLPAGPTGGRG